MDNKDRFIGLCRQVKRDGIEDLLNWLERSDFYTAPASTKFHGSHSGGLLEHSLNVYDELQRILAAYPEVNVSNETVIVISLMHDLCKVNYYATEKRNRKNEQGRWEVYDAYTIKPRVNYGGHGSKSVFILQNFIKLSTEEAVAINCHMGAFCDDWKEVGGAFEQYPIAWLLSMADQSATYIVENKAKG